MVMRRFSDTQLSKEKDNNGLIMVKNKYEEIHHDLWDKTDAINVINHLLEVFDISLDDTDI